MTTPHPAKRQRILGPAGKSTVHKPFRSPIRRDDIHSPAGAVLSPTDSGRVWSLQQQKRGLLDQQQKRESPLRSTGTCSLRPGSQGRKLSHLSGEIVKNIDMPQRRAVGTRDTFKQLPTPNQTQSTVTSTHYTPPNAASEISTRPRSEIPDSESDGEAPSIHAEDAQNYSRGRISKSGTDSALLRDQIALLSKFLDTAIAHPPEEAVNSPPLRPASIISDPAARLRSLTTKWRTAGRDAAELLLPGAAERAQAQESPVRHGRGRGQAQTAGGNSFADEDRILKLERQISLAEKQLHEGRGEYGRAEEGLMLREVADLKAEHAALECGKDTDGAEMKGSHHAGAEEGEDEDDEDDEDVPAFGMGQMLRLLNIEKHILGWNEEEEQWCENRD